MEETWTHEAAFEPRQWHFVNEAKSSLEQSPTPSSSSSTSSCEDYFTFDQQILRFDTPTPTSTSCHNLNLYINNIMSDPFAVRMNFKRAYLDKLTSSPASQLRAAAYALKYREQDEDLHSCILEQLDAVSLARESSW